MRITAASRALIIWALFASAGRAQLPPTAAPSSSPAEARDTASPLPLYATRQNVFAIPFTLDRRIAQPVEVHLYVSTDQGATWQLNSRQPPNARQFTFRSRGDGEYWFSSRTLDASQQASSQGPLRPELRVVVDTVPPQIEFGVRAAEGGEVLVSWQAADQNLLSSSLKIEFQEEAAQPWKPVAVKQPAGDVVRTNYQGQMAWRPDTRSPAINVRAEVRDRAGNLAVVNRRLLLPLQAPQNQSLSADSSTRMSDPFARVGQPSEGAVAWPSDNAAPPPAAPGSGRPASGQAPQIAVQPDPAGQPRNQLASARTASAATDSTAASQPAVSTAPEAAPSLDPPPGAPAGSAPTTTPPPADTALSESSARDLAPLVSAASPGGQAAGAASSMLPPGERPQMTSATRFQLSYDVDAVGPSGVAEVQLWATADGGQTWRLWGTDDDLRSPFDVVVEEEGIFGFHVVVVGRNGLAGRKPRTGDLADIFVGVDTKSPVAKLTAAAYGDGNQAGKLLIRWEASDTYMDARPITLKFSENPAGPWTVIASALPNTGEYAWPADAQVPAAVYLRLEARDEAGNVAVDQLTEPVRIDGLAPRARIRAIQPIRDVDREAFRLPRRG
jgi:hypothetical protein